MAKTIGQLTQATTLASGDEFVIEQSGLTKRVAASVVRGGLVNADIDAAAAIAHTKLANITAGRVLLGNASNVPTATELTGDVTVSNTGVTSIAANAVVTADIADANVTPAKLSQPLTLATAQNTTSGTSIDFTGIPSWVKRITVMLTNMSTSGSSNLLLRLGTSSGFTTTGYTSSVAVISSSPAYTNVFSNAGLIISGTTSTSVLEGVFSIVNQNGNVWLVSGTASRVDGAAFITGYACGGHTLASALDRIRLTTVNGTDTFDAGSVNIMYEG